MVTSQARTALDAHLHAAVASSNLGTLPADVIAELTRGASRVAIPAGTIVHEEGETVPHLDLVVSGLVRVSVSAPDGRSLTVRYCRSGALLGAATLYAPPVRPFAIAALSASELLSLRAEAVRGLADADPRVAGALLTETSERVLTFVAELSEHAFSSVRDRVGRHLLDLAAEGQQGAELVANISQQGLADAVGSVREVIVRVLRELRGEGIVETGRDGIRILEPERLLPPG